MKSRQKLSNTEKHYDKDPNILLPIDTRTLNILRKVLRFLKAEKTMNQ